MKTILKYEIPIKDTFDLDLPAGSRVLCAREQRGIPYMWVETQDVRNNPDYPRVKKTFHVVGTGGPMSEDVGKYIGTVFMFDGDLVWHIFKDKDQT